MTAPKTTKTRRTINLDKATTNNQKVLANVLASYLLERPKDIQLFTKPGEERQLVRTLKEAGYVKEARRVEAYLADNPQLYPEAI